MLHSFPAPCLKLQASPGGVDVGQTQGTTRPVLLLSRGYLDQLLLKSTVIHSSRGMDRNNCSGQHGEPHSMVEMW